jgi:hypothetical protein
MKQTVFRDYIGNMSLVALSPLDDLDTTKMGRSSPICIYHIDNYREEIVPETCIRFNRVYNFTMCITKSIYQKCLYDTKRVCRS